MKSLYFFLLCFVELGCQGSLENLFTDITNQSGILFQNDLAFTEKLNPYTYRNFYNGGGVAVGDINNDGLLDIYLTGNQVDNKLYLNKGNLKFEDITVSAGVSCSGVWSTGVTFVDVNGDGYLDIYVCKSGDPDGPHRNNELFINNQDLTFTEQSRDYGLDVTGLSVQAAFFDYDKDGDLDCYLLTNSLKSVGNFDLVKGLREIPDPLNGGNKFFINENGKFKDHSAESGIYRSAIGFGLGITLGDFNNDSWVDIYISNDFFERDYLYINNQKGGFTESLTDYFQSISMGSMGADFADLDNDGYAELFVTEMLPDSLNRKKTKTIYEGWNKYQLNVENGYHHQFSRNVLQKRVGENSFVEVGRLAGISASEWSWGALLFDMDNDGSRDIFIANGIYKDLLDRDYLTYTGAEENVRKIIHEEKNAILKLIDLMPSSAFPNYAYKNYGDLSFKNMAIEWGLGDAMFSCGSAYGDLDNDGDLDLVVNNINSLSRIYRNNSDTTDAKFISISVSDATHNTYAVGTTAKIYFNGKSAIGDNFVSRGFQSSVTSAIHFGLGKDVSKIDSIKIIWPDGTVAKLNNIKPNQLVTVAKKDSPATVAPSSKKNDYSRWLTLVSGKIKFKHNSSGLIDFNRDRLLPMMYSNESPRLSVGDVDQDSQTEVYVGGGKGQPGAFIHINKNGYELIDALIDVPHAVEETGCLLFDADNDGDIDLYIASGGRFYPNSSSLLQDQIFMNDKKGKFSKSTDQLTFNNFISTSCAKSIDFDNDGDNDLLIGERFDPFHYGLGGNGYLFENDGRGKFTDVTSLILPTLKNIGMVTDIVAGDFDGDGWQDFVVVGDWMSIHYFKNRGKKFEDISATLGLEKSVGWWHNIVSADFNEDGVVDFVIGNHGLNSFFTTDDRLYINDFDKDGAIEQLYCTNVNGSYYPIVDKDEFISQFPSLKKDLLYYRDYSKKSIDQLFNKSVITQSVFYEVDELASVMLLSRANRYEIIKLPPEAQFSTIYALEVIDLDRDGIEDILAGGNQYSVKPQFGRFDASNGWFFKGILKDGIFIFDRGQDMGIKGEIRDIKTVKMNDKVFVVFAKHNDYLEVYQVN